MITKTFKLTVATDTEEQMQKEEEHLSMIYGVEEIEGVTFAYDILDKIRADRNRLQEAIKALSDDMKICQKSITDEKVLLGFNMAVALTNKHLAESEE